MPVEYCSADDLFTVTGNDPFVRSQSRYHFGPAWCLDATVAFVSLDAEKNIRHLASIGDPPRVAELVATAVCEVPEVPRLSVSRGTLPLLPAWLHVEGATDWDFRSTTVPPARQPGEERAGWLDDAADGEVKELLTVANPDTSTWPGEAKVRRWAGIRGARDRLDACLADTSGANGVGHFAAISTRPDARGQGLGAAVTAWATRRLFEEGGDIVTLGMYADNAVARRIYARLGFTDDHRFTSGILSDTQRAAPSVQPSEHSSCPQHW